MKDDLFKKIKSILSGSSPQLEEVSEDKIIDNKLTDEELVNSFTTFELLVGSINI